MKRSRRELSIDIVIHKGIFKIFKNNQITLFSCFTVIPKTGVSFPVLNRFKRYCVIWLNLVSHIFSIFRVKEQISVVDKIFAEGRIPPMPNESRWAGVLTSIKCLYPTKVLYPKKSDRMERYSKYSV